MSHPFSTDFRIPAAEAANPSSIAAAVGEALIQLEQNVAGRKLIPVWDTVEIETEVIRIHERIGFGPGVDTRFTTGTVTVLAISPEEASA